MNCLRCGAEIAEGESFCARCLSDMEKYPVPEDSYVMIPKRSEKRPSVRKSLSDEEKLTIVNGKLKRCRILIAVLLLVIAVLSTFAVWLLVREQGPVVGQNYSTVSSTASTSGPLPTEK